MPPIPLGQTLFEQRYIRAMQSQQIAQQQAQQDAQNRLAHSQRMAELGVRVGEGIGNKIQQKEMLDAQEAERQRRFEMIYSHKGGFQDQKHRGAMELQGLKGEQAEGRLATQEAGKDARAAAAIASREKLAQLNRALKRDLADRLMAARNKNEKIDALGAYVRSLNQELSAAAGSIGGEIGETALGVQKKLNTVRNVYFQAAENRMDVDDAIRLVVGTMDDSGGGGSQSVSKTAEEIAAEMALEE